MLLTLKPWLKIGAVLALVWIILFSLRLHHLYTEAQNTPSTHNETIQPQKTETHDLFEKLMAQKGFVIREHDGRITLPVKDFILARKVAKQPIAKEEQQLLKRLYQSTAGKAVQQQIKRWNHSRRFAAIRDDRPSRDTGGGAGDSVATQWQVQNHWQEKIVSMAWVPLRYGYINAGHLPTRFNDWSSAAAKQVLTFRTTFNLTQKRTIHIQVIGQPDHHQLPANALLSACYPLSEAERRHGKAPACQPVEQAAQDAFAHIITLTLYAGKHTLTINVNPAINQAKQLEGLPIYVDENNQYAWQSVTKYRRNIVAVEDKHYRFSLKTNDGKALTTMQEARPTRFTHQSGLLTLVGYDRSDRYALTGILSRSVLPHDKTEVQLTLESHLQALAQKHMQQEISHLGENTAYAQQRRASVVLMNPKTGGILAAANYPNPPAGIHHWDRLSFSRLYPNRDPFGVNAWQGLNNHNAPGSTFKPVTAMAALQAADEGRDDLVSIIKGLTARSFEQETGIAVSQFSYQPDAKTTSRVNNAGHAPLSLSMPYKNNEGKRVPRFLRTTDGEGCPTRPVQSNDLGLREAVRDSLNVWFARLGVMMDENNLQTGGKDTHLAAMARLLGFGEKPLSLVAGVLPLSRIVGGKGRGDVLNAYAGSLALDNQRLIKREQALLEAGKIQSSTALQRLTQNSFGQGISATPLQMARVMSTIATGYRPTPYLIQQWDGDEIAIPKRSQLKISHIDYLKQGMKAVTETGTARHAFKRFYRNGRCRTYGKTGTAQVAGRGEKRFPFNTVWFVGWREDINGEPDLSFACMVTHAYAHGKDSGGSVCAPIIARILRDMDQHATQQGTGDAQ